MTPTLSIITATCGRDTLTRTLQSLAPQLGDGDELLVLRRDNSPRGNAARDEAIKRAAGSHLYWVDDDDIAAEGALAIIRAAVAEDPEMVHMFRMDGDIYHDGIHKILWNEPVISFGHIGGSMVVVPNIPEKLGTWVHPKQFGGDFHFLTQTLEKSSWKVRWHEDVIAHIRPL